MAKNSLMRYTSLLLTIVGMILVGLLSSESAVAAGRKVKIALDAPPNPETSGTFVWANTFGEFIKSRGLSISVYQRGALGGEDEKLDQVRQGLLEVSMSDVAMIGGLDKTIFGFTQPYMFKSLEHLDRAIANSDLMDRINRSINPKGVRLLALVSSGTPGGLANTKKVIKSPDDIPGLRIRAKDGMQAQFIEAWGANTVIVPWGEIYNALQTGVADGYLNSPVVPLMFKHEEILKYFSDIAFNIPLRAAICSEDWYQGLSGSDRKAVEEAVVAATWANRQWTTRISAKALDNLKAAGVTVYDNSDAEIRLFSERVKKLYAKTLGEQTAKRFLDAAAASR